ncbi:hypothetical protein Cni_G12952 [Canna indica]|uniref:SWIM-type domain-containing protein n=1 Tax=Canna indica TaxID=4628 RepID=A0AAQ3QC93_9LILI|nr:hypothetical protein Cni_G12952 [Canna indica]
MPRKRLEKHVVESAKWRASWAGGSKYEVRNFDIVHFTVDMKTRDCSCRLWGLCELPCPHAVCAIYAHNGDPEEFVENCYSIDTYAHCYVDSINPINGKNIFTTFTAFIAFTTTTGDTQEEGLRS